MAPAGGSLIARGALSLALALSAGCGSGEGGEALPEVVAPPPPPPTGAPAGEALYGPEGELLESDQRVAGLVLPRGLEHLVDEGRRHVYTTDVPITKVQQYFGVRLVTGAVDAPEGRGVTYRDAVPRDVRGGEVHLDVSIEPASGAEARIEIVELEPPPASPPSEAETIERARRAIEQGE